MLMLEPEWAGLIGLLAILPYAGEALYRWAKRRIRIHRWPSLCLFR